MTDQWLVYSPSFGSEEFRDYRHFIRRFRELCAQADDKASLQVQLPPTATSLERMIIAKLAAARRLGP